jgi:hypothetical protein
MSGEASGFWLSMRRIVFLSGAMLFAQSILVGVSTAIDIHIANGYQRYHDLHARSMRSVWSV